MKPFTANVKSPVGVWSVVGTDEGVTHIHLPHEALTASKGAAPRAVADAAQQLKEYFAGARRTFRVTLAASPATSFQNDVFDALRIVPAPIAPSATRITPIRGRSSCRVTGSSPRLVSVATALVTR
jgi:hypothetical protein